MTEEQRELPVYLETVCSACNASTLLEYKGSNVYKDMRVDYYDCLSCGSTRSLSSLERENTKIERYYKTRLDERGLR